jgi:hypothetical protein
VTPRCGEHAANRLAPGTSSQAQASSSCGAIKPGSWTGTGTIDGRLPARAMFRTGRATLATQGSRNICPIASAVR